MIRGTAYQRAASLDLDDAMLVWRAQRGHVHPTPELFHIPLDEVRILALVAQRWTWSSTLGVTAFLLAILWMASGHAAFGAVAAAVGAAMVAFRRWRPTWHLVIVANDQRLVLGVSRRSLPEARAMVDEHGRVAQSLPQATVR